MFICELIRSMHNFVLGCRTRKKHVVVSSRVHPGESNASWMVKGLVDFITGDSKEAVVSVNELILKM